MYTTADVFQLIIEVEVRAAAFYNEFAEQEEIERSLRTMSLVLAAEERRHEKVYRKITGTLQHSEVPVDLYHRASQLIGRFRPMLQESPETIGGLLSFAIALERENLALVIRLRDLFRARGEQEELLKTLDGIVEEEETHVDQLEKIAETRKKTHA